MEVAMTIQELDDPTDDDDVTVGSGLGGLVSKGDKNCEQAKQNTESHERSLAGG